MNLSTHFALDWPAIGRNLIEYQATCSIVQSLPIVRCLSSNFTPNIVKGEMLRLYEFA